MPRTVQPGSTFLSNVLLSSDSAITASHRLLVAGLHRRPHVDLVAREQAVLQPPVGGQPQAVAPRAEVVGHRADEAHRTLVTREAVVLGRPPTPGRGHRLEHAQAAAVRGAQLLRAARTSALVQRLACGARAAPPTGIHSMKRTCRGRSRVSSTKAGSSGSSSGIMTTFSFTGLRSERSAASTPAKDVLQRAAPGQLPIALRVERVQADVHPVEALGLELLGEPGQQHSVGGQRDVPDLGDGADQPTRSGTPLRTRGSPPVSRTLRMPICTATRTKKAMSS